MKTSILQRRKLFALYTRQRESAERNKRLPDYWNLSEMWRAAFVIDGKLFISVYGLNARIDQTGGLTLS